MVSRDLAAFLGEGLGIHVATRNAAFMPNGGRALALAVSDDGTEITVYLASIVLERLRADLEANGQLAVGVARPPDERACQIKGFFLGVRDARPDERPRVEGQFRAFLDNLEYIGIPREPMANWTLWPASAIRMRVTALFEQTPGARAGEPLS